MLMPSIFGENLFDEFFNDFPFYDDKEERRLEKKLYGRRAQNLMKTDIKEMDQGYLTISATKGLEKEEKDNDNGHYIRRERYAGTCERSFYVGEHVTQEDIKAEFKHGILKLFVPKKEAVPAVEESKYISIEG